MKLFGAALILFLIFSFYYVFAQKIPYQNRILVSSNYAEAPLQKGLPEIEPGKEYNLSVKDPSYAWMNPVGGFDEIYFIKGNKGTKEEKYWIFTVSGNSGNSLIPAVVTHRTHDEIFGRAVITQIQSRIFSFVLSFIYSRQSNELKYSWPSGINESNGTIIPVIKTGSNINISQLPFFSQLNANGNLNNKTIFLNYVIPYSNAGYNSFTEFDSLYGKYGVNKNIVFISIGSDKNSAVAAGNYYLLKADSSVSAFFGNIYPQNIIIDRSGNVVYSGAGYSKNEIHNISKVLSGYKVK